MDYTANGVLGIRRQLERVLIFKPVPFASRPHVEARPPVLTWASSWPSSQKNFSGNLHRTFKKLSLNTFSGTAIDLKIAGNEN
jgi:hypothetical protein